MRTNESLHIKHRVSAQLTPALVVRMGEGAVAVECLLPHALGLAVSICYMSDHSGAALKLAQLLLFKCS